MRAPSHIVSLTGQPTSALAQPLSAAPSNASPYPTAPAVHPPPALTPPPIVVPAFALAIPPTVASDQPETAKTPAATAAPSAGQGVKPADLSFVHKVASPAVTKKRHLGLIASFGVTVILPVLVGTYYLFAVAEDQYASYLGFSVQREDANSAIELLGGLTKLSGGGAPDHLILYKYIKSRDMLSAVAKDVDLAEAFSRSDDPFFSLAPDATIEEQTDYWARMVRVYLDSGSGLIEMEVRAFTPETAQAIAQGILKESTRLLNNLSDIAKMDATSFSRQDLDAVTLRLRTAQETLTAFRSRNQMVDPTTDLQGRTGLLNSLLAQQAAALIDMDLLADNTGDSDPRRAFLQRRIDVIGARIAAERNLVSASNGAGDASFADLVSEFERLQLEQEFAQRAYVAALSLYDGAVANASRSSRYLATYLPPTLAQKSEYPRRLQSITLLFGGLFLFWSIMVLTYYSVRDRR